MVRPTPRVFGSVIDRLPAIKPSRNPCETLSVVLVEVAYHLNILTPVLYLALIV